MSVCESFPKKRAILAVQFDGVVYCLAGNISLKPQNNSDGICLERRIVKNDRTQIAPPGEKPSAIDSDLLPCNGRHCRKSSHNHENTCFHGEHYTKKSLICV